jgi:hypothetical protein
MKHRSWVFNHAPRGIIYTCRGGIYDVYSTDVTHDCQLQLYFTLTICFVRKDSLSMSNQVYY